MASLLVRFNDELIQVAIADYFYGLMINPSTPVEQLKLIIASSKYGYKQQGRRSSACAHYFRHIIARCSSRMRYTEFYDVWHNASQILQS